MKRFFLLLAFTTAVACLGFSEPIPARHKQGSMHGFLLVKSPQGDLIAAGDLLQVAQGDVIHSRLVFRFHDGSIDEESAVFSQRDVLRLMTDHHVQKGPSFPHPVDCTINVPKGSVTWRQMKNDIAESHTDSMDLPDDLANGMIASVMNNIAADETEKTVSFLTNTPKPRIVKLDLKPEGQESFSVGGFKHPAVRFDIHVDLGGFASIVAPLFGKQPSDLRGWVIAGEVPCFAKMEGAFYQGGPIWTVELTSPVWTSSLH